MDRQGDTVYIFTDNCSSQNKNYALVQYLYTIVVENTFELKTIIHRYSEPVHSFLPCDKAFGIIEKRRRKLENAFLPDDYRELVKNTCKQFTVINVN